MGKLITRTIGCILSVTTYTTTAGASSNYLSLRKNRDLSEVIEVVPQNDIDSYGCTQSEGYKWCNSRQECIQSWGITPCNDCKIHITCNIIYKKSSNIHIFKYLSYK